MLQTKIAYILATDELCFSGESINFGIPKRLQCSGSLLCLGALP